MIHFNAEQVAAKEHEELNPERHDFFWNRDYTECDAVPLDIDGRDARRAEIEADYHEESARMEDHFYRQANWE